MFLTAIAAFVLAVTLGLALVVLGVRKRRGSLPIAVAHAGSAVLGLGLLVFHIFNTPTTERLHNLAALLFVLTLLGGLVLLALRINKREYRTPPPMSVVILHAAVGVFALVFLLV